MAKRDTFITIRTEGALLPPDLLQQIAFGSGIDGLSPESYHLAGERLNEAITRAWNRMLGAWANFKSTREKLAESDAGTTTTRERWLMPLFQELGYGRLQTSRAYEIEGKTYHISHMWEGTPIHLITFRADLDTRMPGTVGASRMSPHGMMQEFLNRTDEHLWAFLSNGLRLRILRDNSSLTRQAYLEFDIEAMMEGEVYADFALLWLLCHQSRVEGDKPEECWLEKWSRFAQETGKRVMEKFRVSVEEAIATLGAGFIACPANRELRDNLRVGTVDRQDYYRQVLRVVYRLIFLFVAEDRDVLLLPDAPQQAKDTYTKYYSTARLRRLAEKRRGTPHVDLMRGLWLLFDKLGNDGCPEIALPTLGSFLWSNDAVAEIAGCDISNKDLLAAIHRLAFTVEDNVRRPVDYRNLGSEELGSVYESLLELHPEMNLEAGTFVLRTAGGNDRKTTGSYYTPPSLIDCLLDSALDPVLNDACRKPNPQEAVLDLKIVDPACGSGHFLVRAAHRVAKRLAALRTGDDEPSPEAVRHALRDVIGRCIYGVDINPMSVELCKVSLWMESLEPGKPLSFLDHHIQCGNSLLGVPLPSQVEAAKAEIEQRRKALEAQIEDLRIPAARDRELDKERKRLLKELKGLRYVGYPESIPDEAFTPLEGDVKEICQHYRKQNAQEREQGGLFAGDMQPWQQLGDLAAAVGKIEDIDDGDIAGVRRKQRLYEELRRSDRFHSGRFLADAWCAAFVWKKVDRDSYPITHQVFTRILHNPHDVPVWMREEIDRLTAQYQFFHWHIAFPEVFSPLAGTTGGVVQGVEVQHDPRPSGFDVVLGNPPWERIRLQEREWFAASRPDIASTSNTATRRKMIKALVTEDPALYQAFIEDGRKAEGESELLRASGKFPLCGCGDINTFAVFAEEMRTLLGEQGYAGIIVPSGIATDDTTKYFFQDITSKRSLSSLYDFENRQGIFPGVHRSYKFCLMTMTGSARPTERGTDFVFFAQTTDDLRDHDRHFTLAADDIDLLNPNTHTCSIFRTFRDAELCKQIYRRVPVLVKDGDETGNPWGVTIRRVLDMGNPEVVGICTNQADRSSVIQLYEAKLFHQYDHRWASYVGTDTHDVPPLEKEDPAYSVTTKYWVALNEVADRIQSISGNRDWLLGFRNIARATDERTTILSVLPMAGTDFSIRALFSPQKAQLICCLIASFNSLPFDYVTRQMLGGTNLSDYITKQLPVLPPAAFSNDAQCFIVPRVVELVYSAWDVKLFCDEVWRDSTPYQRDLIRQRWDENHNNATGEKGYDRQSHGEPMDGIPLPPFRWSSNRRAEIRAELDAYIAILVGLSRDELRYILDPTDIHGNNFPSETFRVLKEKEVKVYGEYRTRRLVLEAWDWITGSLNTTIDNKLHTEQTIVPNAEDPQVFPQDGRETFVYDCVMQSVSLREGRQYEYFVATAILASRPERLRKLLSAENRSRLDTLRHRGLDADALPEQQAVRLYDIREDLTDADTGCLAVDSITGATTLKNPAAVPPLDDTRRELLLLALDAAERLYPAAQPVPVADNDVEETRAFLAREMAGAGRKVHR